MHKKTQPEKDMQRPLKRTVLIVDDDSMIRQVLRLMLREAGFILVGEAADGDEGLAACVRYKPDVVCLDINMPGTDGLSTLQKIKTERPGTIVIMVTGDASATAVKEAIAKGAAGYIVKPFNAAKVIGSIESLVEAAHRTAASPH
jgi:two-component system, chemotaxis family, chemotaxis protein CheY